MAILRTNFASGVLDAAITAAATSATSTATSATSGFAGLPVVASPDVVVVVLDYDRVAGAPEVIHVTAHTAASATATILRGQAGTTARAHAAGVKWAAAATKEVLEDFIASIAAVDAAAAAAGSSTQFARGDHKHALTVGSPVASAPGDAAADGTSTAAARADHKHAREAWALDVDLAAPAAAASAGTGIKVARNDHVHPFGPELIRRDASVPFTAVPAGPATDPSTANQFTRKAYVDAAALARPKFPNALMKGASVPTGGNFSTTQAIIQSEQLTVVTNSSGFGAVVFPVVFTGLLSVVLTGWVLTGPKGVLLTLSSQAVDNFMFFAVDHNGAALVSASLIVNYIAIGY